MSMVEKLDKKISCVFLVSLVCFLPMMPAATDRKETMAKEPLKPFSELARTLAKGTYRHYSGKTYQVLGVGRHSETLEEVVLYKALYGDEGLWVRPLSLFCETVEINGIKIPRFQLVQ